MASANLRDSSFAEKGNQLHCRYMNSELTEFEGLFPVIMVSEVIERIIATTLRHH
jgi:hypothetical protein